MSTQLESINIYEKIGLYISSLWLLFVLVIILKVDVPISFSPTAEFIGIWELLKRNTIPLVSLSFLLIGIGYTIHFKYKFDGTTPTQIKVTKLKNINYEHITFLTTYIIPLMSFDLSNSRYLLLLVFILFVIGVIYIKTNLYYANPTLALLGYHIYKLSGVNNYESDDYSEITVITREKIKNTDEIKVKLLSGNIYFGRKA